MYNIEKFLSEHPLTLEQEFSIRNLLIDLNGKSKEQIVVMLLKMYIQLMTLNGIFAD